MNYLDRRRAAWRATFRVLGLLAVIVAALGLFGCAGAGRKVADFFGGLFSTAAPALDAAGQPWFGALFSWAGRTLLDHPYESAGAAVAAAVPVNHWINGTPGTRRRRDVREVRVAKKAAAARTKAQMRLLDADTHHRKVAAAAEEKVRRSIARKNAALIAANQHVKPQEKEA